MKEEQYRPATPGAGADPGGGGLCVTVGSGAKVFRELGGVHNQIPRAFLLSLTKPILAPAGRFTISPGGWTMAAYLDLDNLRMRGGGASVQGPLSVSAWQQRDQLEAWEHWLCAARGLSRICIAGAGHGPDSQNLGGHLPPQPSQGGGCLGSGDVGVAPRPCHVVVVLPPAGAGPTSANPPSVPPGRTQSGQPNQRGKFRVANGVGGSNSGLSGSCCGGQTARCGRGTIGHSSVPPSPVPDGSEAPSSSVGRRFVAQFGLDRAFPSAKFP